MVLGGGGVNERAVLGRGGIGEGWYWGGGGGATVLSYNRPQALRCVGKLLTSQETTFLLARGCRKMLCRYKCCSFKMSAHSDY